MFVYFPCFPVAVSKQHFVLSGQHLYAACREIADELGMARQAVPFWCQNGHRSLFPFANKWTLFSFQMSNGITVRIHLFFLVFRMEELLNGWINVKELYLACIDWCLFSLCCNPSRNRSPNPDLNSREDAIFPRGGGCTNGGRKDQAFIRWHTGTASLQHTTKL